MFCLRFNQFLTIRKIRPLGTTPAEIISAGNESESRNGKNDYSLIVDYYTLLLN